MRKNCFPQSTVYSILIRTLYRFGACPPVLIIIFRFFLPETKAYQERQAVRAAKGNVAGTFVAEGKVALKRHWLLLTYLVLLMAGFNFMVCSLEFFNLLHSVLIRDSRMAPRIYIPPC